MTLSQTEILLSLVQGIEGRAWSLDRTGWEYDSQFDVCLWEGVECDTIDKFTIIGLNLPGADLAATVPSELGLLTTLREITLPRNILRGSIPLEIAALPHLETLNMKQNHLTGTIPYFSSPNFRSLDLSYNEIGGTIPHDFGNRHERLTDFNIMQNRLFGPIPDSLAELKSLNTLTLSENGLSGTIPVSLGEAKSLHYLYLDNNFIVGTIPAELARMGSPLEEFWLQHNYLSGTIPAAIADLEDLFNFYIDGNKFTGTIPPELCREDLNEDFFEGVPEDAPRNQCDSIACPSGDVSFEGVYPCQPCNQKYYNPYLGRVGECIDLNQRDILQILYDNAGGAQWTGIIDKWEKGVDDYCKFTGVTCDNNGNIIELSLKGMNLNGRIPDEIGYLRYLSKLDVSDNYLTGYLPSDLRWAPLEFLDISGNQLVGLVPPMLCLKGNINGNGEGGEFGCDHIACPAGTFSHTGTGSIIPGDVHCSPCPTSVYLASRSCPTYTTPNGRNNGPSVGKAFGIFLLITGVVGLMIFGLAIAKKRLREKNIIRDNKHINLAYQGVSENDLA
eukprot:CAMPEP_0172479780 /NCGR_PEP_ID=MMETSP1066-20121228/4589_1 /TAXON_ID=671091 /ORGANISM="Coscinodiscus wailesii, Strain CCMP2513" /LENGTH=558 /DNA_ID=CAMNT_0013240549 /DNA_START=152 /DNA_END=1828 /DNA_ORIENTATION=-